jgi:hypothetical protein
MAIASGQRYPGNLVLDLEINIQAMTPGIKQGAYDRTFKRPLICDWSMARTTEAHHSRKNVRSLDFRARRKRKGKKMYICTSMGSDHNTKIMSRA